MTRKKLIEQLRAWCPMNPKAPLSEDGRQPLSASLFSRSALPRLGQPLWLLLFLFGLLLLSSPLYSIFAMSERTLDDVSRLLILSTYLVEMVSGAFVILAFVLLRRPARIVTYARLGSAILFSMAITHIISTTYSQYATNWIAKSVTSVEGLIYTVGNVIYILGTIALFGLAVSLMKPNALTEQKPYRIAASFALITLLRELIMFASRTWSVFNTIFTLGLPYVVLRPPLTLALVGDGLYALAYWSMASTMRWVTKSQSRNRWGEDILQTVGAALLFYGSAETISRINTAFSGLSLNLWTLSRWGLSAAFSVSILYAATYILKLREARIDETEIVVEKSPELGWKPFVRGLAQRSLNLFAHNVKLPFKSKAGKIGFLLLVSCSLLGGGYLAYLYVPRPIVVSRSEDLDIVSYNDSSSIVSSYTLEYTVNTQYHAPYFRIIDHTRPGLNLVYVRGNWSSNILAKYEKSSGQITVEIHNTAAKSYTITFNFEMQFILNLTARPTQYLALGEEPRTSCSPISLSAGEESNVNVTVSPFKMQNTTGISRVSILIEPNMDPTKANPKQNGTYLVTSTPYVQPYSPPLNNVVPWSYRPPTGSYVLPTTFGSHMATYLVRIAADERTHIVRTYVTFADTRPLICTIDSPSFDGGPYTFKYARLYYSYVHVYNILKQHP